MGHHGKRRAPPRRKRNAAGGCSALVSWSRYRHERSKYGDHRWILPTGESTWIREAHPAALRVDLLAPEVHRAYLARPERLRELVGAHPRHSVVVIDEVQRVPALLDVVHELIEARGRGRTRFILTGSSARSSTERASTSSPGEPSSAGSTPACSAPRGPPGPSIVPRRSPARRWRDSSPNTSAPGSRTPEANLLDRFAQGGSIEIRSDMVKELALETRPEAVSDARDSRRAYADLRPGAASTSAPANASAYLPVTFA
jgi:hypothetical protein